MKQFKTPIYRRRHGCRKCPLLGGFVFWGTLRNIEYYDTLDIINILVNKNYRWIGNPTHSLFLLCIKMRFLCLRTRPQPGAYNEEENNAFKWTKFLERQLKLRTFSWYLVPLFTGKVFHMTDPFGQNPAPKRLHAALLQTICKRYTMYTLHSNLSCM